jgi:hypothetical protein
MLFGLFSGFLAGRCGSGFSRGLNYGITRRPVPLGVGCGFSGPVGFYRRCFRFGLRLFGFGLRFGTAHQGGRYRGLFFFAIAATFAPAPFFSVFPAPLAAIVSTPLAIATVFICLTGRLLRLLNRTLNHDSKLLNTSTILPRKAILSVANPRL